MVTLQSISESCKSQTTREESGARENRFPKYGDFSLRSVVIIFSRESASMQIDISKFFFPLHFYRIGTLQYYCSHGPQQSVWVSLPLVSRNHSGSFLTL